MKKSILILATVFFCTSVLPASESAEESLRLTVDEAVKMALENNVSVKSSQLSLKLKSKQKATSWNSASPTASLSANYNNDLEKKSYSYGFTGSVNLNLTPSLFTSIKNAVINYEAGELSYEDTLRSVELNVRKSFYNLLYAKENIASLERNLETAQQTYDSNSSKYNRGQLSELDLLSSQYSVDSKKPVIEQAKNNYQNNIANFKQILGIELSKDVELIGNLDEGVQISITEEILNESVENVPSVKKIENSLKSAKNSLLATRFSAYAPSLTASYSYGKTQVKDAKEMTTSQSVSIGARIPLDGYLPWSTGAMSVTAQKENVEELKLKLEDAKTSARISVRNSYNTILQAQSQLETLRKNVTLMQRTYDMMRIAYNNGSRDLLTLQNAADNLLAAKTSLQSGEYTLISSVLELENTLGVPFGTFASK